MRFYRDIGAVVGGFVILQARQRIPISNRDTNRSWTNAEYNDGVCHYKYRT